MRSFKRANLRDENVPEVRPVEPRSVVHDDERLLARDNPIAEDAHALATHQLQHTLQQPQPPTQHGAVIQSVWRYSNGQLEDPMNGLWVMGYGLWVLSESVHRQDNYSLRHRRTDGRTLFIT